MIDFGSSCYENQRVYTYIQSRFYRAPEVILGAKYGMAIDMWSLGCILAELLTGYALLPGEDESDQLACMMELLGMPPKKLLLQSKRVKNFFNTKGYPRYLPTPSLDEAPGLRLGISRRGKFRGPPGSKDIKKALKGCDDPMFTNFLMGCLEWDPEERMTPAVALKHSWFRRRLPRPPNSSSPSSNSHGMSMSVTGTSSSNTSSEIQSQQQHSNQQQQQTYANVASFGQSNSLLMRTNSTSNLSSSSQSMISSSRPQNNPPQNKNKIFVQNKIHS